MSLADAADHMIDNALLAGKHLEGKGYFGKVESPFIITPGQTGKVKGDVYELLCRAVLWNCCSYINNSKTISLDNSDLLDSVFSKSVFNKKIAILSLGDNYDLKKLFKDRHKKIFLDFELSLEKRGTSLCYSTPDIVCVDITALESDVVDHFSRPITNLSLNHQSILQASRSVIEGRLSPSDILFAAGIKTSIRSDRMYQFLFEANAWKFLWKRVFTDHMSRYYVLLTRYYGANPSKLSSVAFVSVDEHPKTAEPAIDNVCSFISAKDLMNWLCHALNDHSDSIET
jgi:hypothetical protein